MPPAKKDVSVILFDVNTKSHQKAVQTLMKICCNKYFNANNKDLTKLILVNSDITENRLAARHGGYNHINEICKDVIGYNPGIFLEMVENSGTGEANFLEAIHVGLMNLQEEYKQISGIVTYQLLFITDLNSTGTSNKKILDKIVNSINQLEAFLYVVGPEVEVPFTIKNENDIKKWMNELTIGEDNNLKSIKDIITQTKNSVVCNYEIGWELFFSYRKWGGGQPWQVPLGVGSDIQLPAKTLKIFDEVIHLKLSSDGFGEKKWINAEDESIEIERQDVLEGIMRHEKFVQMPDDNMFKLQTIRSFNVLCFTDSKNVPEYMMGGDGCYCVLPNGTAEKNEVFNIFIDALAQQNKYVIARRVYNNNFAPKIVVLVPQPNHHPKCFYLTSLPFADDVRVSLKEKDAKLAPKEEIPKEVAAFLNSLVIDRDEPEKKIPLGINMMQDINMQKLVNKAADKFLERDLNLAEVDIDYSAPTQNDAVQALMKIWPTRKLNEVKKEENVGDGAESDDDFDW